MDATRFRIGDWVFDPATGDLLEGGPGRRLEPQAARLLAALVEHAGEVTTREQLREALRIDAATDAIVDQCIREVRSALGDDGDPPRYVETAGGEGCRLIAPVSPLGPRPPAPPDRSMGRLGLALVVVLGAITIFWFGPASRVAERRAEQDRAREEAVDRLASPAGRAAGVVVAPRPLRLALLAQELPAGAESEMQVLQLLEGFAAEFAAVDSDDLGTVGPITDGAWVGSGRSHREVGAELGVDYLLTVSIGEAGTGVQLIRVWDGSALFATQFPAGTDLAAIRGTVAAGVVTAIEQDAERPLR